MATFDIKTFAELTGQGQGPITSLGTTFGLPSCMLNLTQDLLQLLPGGVLGGIAEATDTATEKANQLVGNIFNKLGFKAGILSYITESGSVNFQSNSSEILGNSGEKSFVNDLLGFSAGLAAVGGQLYSNYQMLQSQADQIQQCIDAFAALKQFSGGLAAEQRAQLNSEQYERVFQEEYAKYANQLSAAREALDALAALARRVAEEQRRRNQIPNSEPRVANEYAYLFSGTGIVIDDDEEEPEEIIRLVYGPPISSKGRYLLSTDGLYYDSQGASGLEPVLLFVSDNEATLEAANKWRFSYNPNLGGKGDQLSSKTFNQWINSIFDPNIINESEQLRYFYEGDHFLKVLEGQKEKRILDINKQIQELEESDASQSVIENFKQSLLSEVAYHNDKVNRRKKQIEIAVLAPSIFNKGSAPERGKVPINDFSYLQDCNISVALESQKRLILNQEDVSGVVLPIKASFVVSKSVDAVQGVDHLIVPEVGLGAIITDNRDPTESSSVELSMSDVITSDGLMSVYNFLNSKTVVPSSLDFDVLNCNTTNDYNNAQLVAPDAEFVFGKSDKATLSIGYGLGAAYLEGITKNLGTNPSALGSYVKLPDTTEFQDWLYNRSGATFDAWVYAPYLTFDESWDEGLATSSLYRLILACENVGSLSSVTRSPSESILSVGYTDGSDYTRGMIMGFTRDIRWRGQVGPSNDGSIQRGRDGGFILAPTVAYDGSSVAFVAKAKAQNTCSDTSGWIGMYVPLSQATNSGKTLEACSDGFCQLSVTFDYRQDKVSLYLDSEVLATSAISEVFGTAPRNSIKLPTFKKANSFEYKESTVGPLAPRSLKGGPKLNSFFTPWILGGGYTDGMANAGNFMGGEYGGVRSGLRGYLGSTKFYSKPLTQKELKFNYSIQSKLYKNLEGVQTKLDVVIAVGQSNIDGGFVPLSSPGVPERFKQIQTNVKIWKPDSLIVSSGSWVDLDASNVSDPNYGGYNASRHENFVDPATRFIYNSTRHYDPVMQFMYRLSEDTENDVYLIKNTKNATAMVSGLTGSVDVLSWTDENQTLAGIQGYDLYFTLKNDLSAAIESLQAPYKEVNVKAILMMQGEFEAGYLAGQANYPNQGDLAAQWANYFSGTLYPRLQSDVKAALGTPGADDIPWIFTRTHEELEQNILFAHTQAVRTQQESVAARPDLEAYIVDVDGLSFVDNGVIHFDAQSLTTIGNRLYDKYKEINS